MPQKVHTHFGLVLFEIDGIGRVNMVFLMISTIYVDLKMELAWQEFESLCPKLCTYPMVYGV